ncbi:MAG: hypothetical protein K2I96_23290, partial [Lachnospiraceae bacterium]|nr:hypothetical protein [Lachnospiraceae bacterium]
MKQRMVQRISNGEMIDLAKLNRKKLKRLHYEEEKCIAKKICTLSPFSKDRDEYLKKMYDFAYAVMPWYQSSKKQSYGANANSIGIVCDFLRADKTQKVIYEAGVGIGFSCRHFVEIPNTQVKGCDVVMSKEIKLLMEQYQ